MNNTGVKLACVTLLTTAVLDILSWKEVLKLKKLPNGMELYMQGWKANVINNIFVGSITYKYVSLKMISRSNHSMFEVLQNSAEMVLWHAIFYYIFHRLMHTVQLYKIHKFHHRFNKVILASAANAVSILEYMFAYMLPFVLGCLVVNPNKYELLLSASVVSFFNLMVHTPLFKELKLPWFMVGAGDHFEHHMVQRKNYAAPTFNIDNILREFILLQHD